MLLRTLLLLAVSAPLVAGQVSFRAARTFPAGIPVARATTADFNRDGTPDFAVAGVGISVVFGNADGTLRAPNVLADRLYYDLAAGDVNGDNLTDIVTLNGLGSIVSFVNKGDGTFETISTSRGTAALTLALADFNGDGKLDVAAAGLSSSKVDVSLGTGDGTWGPVVSYDAPGSPFLVVTGDMTGDRAPDFATLSYAGSVMLYANRGDGSFNAGIAVATAYATSTSISLDAADFDTDGVTDLLFVAPDGRSTTILLARGNGTFVTRTIAPTGVLHYVAYAADVDGTGATDVIIDAEIAGGTFQFIYTNDGNAGFTAASQVPVRGRPVTADLDHDGKPELIQARYSARALAVSRGLGGGRFLAGEAVQSEYTEGIAGRSKGRRVSAADIDGDGRADLIGINNNDTFSWLRSNGDGTFRSPSTHSVASPSIAIAGDINGDSRNDVIVFSSTTRTISAFLNQGGGSFGAPVVTATPDAAGLFIDIRVVDVTSDGRADIVLTENASVHVFRAAGDGMFVSTARLPVDAVVAGDSVVADFDRDGRIDIISTWSAGSGGAQFAKGAGDGTFAPAVRIETPLNGQRAATGDLNRDGRPDVVRTFSNALSPTADAVIVLLGNGDGTFRSTVYQERAGGPGAVTIGDIDADGFPDVVTVNFTSGDVSVYRGDGTGALQSAVRYSVVSPPSSVALADFNDDQKLDIAASGFAENLISILINDSPAPFARRRTVRTR